MRQITNATMLEEFSFSVERAVLVKLQKQVVPEAPSAEELQKQYEAQLESSAKVTSAIQNLENLIEANVIQSTMGSLERVIFRPRNAIELVKIDKNESLFYVIEDNIIFKK